jgi:NitT/TauT family transport system substrate-binding protein
MRYIIFAAALAMPTLAAAGTPVNVGVVTWIGYGPIYCAAANGYYKKYGLDVKLVNFSDNSVMAGAVQSGELDATTMTYDQVIASNARGWKLKVVMPVDYSVGGDAILAGAKIQSVKDLKGPQGGVHGGFPVGLLIGLRLGEGRHVGTRCAAGQHHP